MNALSAYSSSESSSLCRVLALYLALCDGGLLGSVNLSYVTSDSSSCIQIVLTLDQPRCLTVKALKTPTYPKASCFPESKDCLMSLSLFVSVSYEQTEQYN